MRFLYKPRVNSQLLSAYHTQKTETEKPRLFSFAFGPLLPLTFNFWNDKYKIVLFTDVKHN